MAYEVPPLPYAYDALEPHIDEATMKFHHDKHHQAYVDKANAALEGTELGRQADRGGPREPRSAARGQADAVRNNGGGHYNHSLFWESLSGDGGGEPDGDLADAIDSRLRLVRRLQGEGQGDRRQPVRVRLGVARPRRLRPRGRRHRQPGQPDLRGPDAAARRRRLGARVLPQVPEQAPGLHRRVVERRRLGQGRRAVLRGRVVPNCGIEGARFGSPRLFTWWVHFAPNLANPTLLGEKRTVAVRFSPRLGILGRFGERSTSSPWRLDSTGWSRRRSSRRPGSGGDRWRGASPLAG